MSKKIVKPAKIKYKKLSNSKGRTFCDDMWSDMVKMRDGRKCVICNATEYINSHHLISRRIFALRFNVDNGISLCPQHHEYDLHLSAHTAPWNFDEWVKTNKPEQYNNWLENRKVIVTGEQTNYEQLYYNMEHAYKKITGNFFRIERISPYILSLNVDKIKQSLETNSTLSDNKKIALIIDLMKEFNIGQTAVKEFLKQNKLIA